MTVETAVETDDAPREAAEQAPQSQRPGWKRWAGEGRRVLCGAAGLFPLTPAGMLLLVLAGIALAFLGVKRSDLVVLAAACLCVVLTLLLALGVFASALLLRLALRKRPEGAGLLMECGSLQATGFRPPWPARLPLLELQWTWEYPPAAEVVPEMSRGRWLETVVLRRRGDHHAVVRRYEVRDVLGLTSVSWRERDERPVRALPHRGKLDTLALLDGLAGGDDLSDPRGEPVGDRVDMRQYVQGDSPRMILWKVYARTRKLLVRVPERAVAAKPRTCAYLVAGAGDEASAGLVRVVLERGFLGENWRFGADGNAGFASSLDGALDLLVRSGNADPEGKTCLREFLARAERDGYSACFLAVPPGEGSWVEAALEAAASTRIRIHLCAGVDGPGETRDSGPRWKRLLLLSGSPSEAGAGDLRSLARRFGSAPFPCLLVSRTEGRVLGDLRQIFPVKEKVP